jgi:CheY-like chemotaxis protein
MREKGGTLEVILNEVEVRHGSNMGDSIEAGSYVRLIVKDTGHGIETSLIERIFDPFFTTKDRSEGTGMGLAVVHGIVKSYGGMVKVKSEINVGTTFEIYFPKAEHEAMQEADNSQVLPTGTERVLLVDDEISMINSVKSMLKYLGYEVVDRTSSVEALEAFREHPDDFDIIVTDMTMPNMTGKELAREVLKIRPNTPVVLCTGFSDQINDETAKSMGIKDFVIKPLVMKDMAITIRNALDS